MGSDKKDYIFRSFWDREECYKILNAFLSKYRNGGFENYRKQTASAPTAVAEAAAATPAPSSTNSADAAGSTSELIISDGAVSSSAAAAADSVEGSSKRSSVGRPTSASVVSDDVVDTG